MSEDQDVEDDGIQEIEAMRVVGRALGALDPGARDRVLQWTNKKYGSAGSSVVVTTNERTVSSAFGAQVSSPQASPAVDLAELYAKCQPQTDAEKTLVVSFWLQEFEGAIGIDAQSVNTQLKHLGHGVGNITRAFDKLMEQRPQLMIQTKKAGSTKQARKTFRVTLEGKKAVEQMQLGAARSG